LLRGQSRWSDAVRATAPPGMTDRDLLYQPVLDPLAFRGIAFAILFAIPLWAALALVVDWIISAH
jgi:hypothetical protein